MIKKLSFFLFFLASFSKPLIWAQAGFSVDHLSGCVPLVVNFSSEAEAAVAWSWDFGNGITSSFENPGVIYGKAGNYTVSLTITFADGSESFVHKEGYIQVDELPVPNFKLNNEHTCLGEELFLSALNGNQLDPELTWTWDMGNGQTLEGEQIIYTYEKTGTYTLTLDALGKNNCRATRVFPNAITIHSIPDAAFTFSNGFSCNAPSIISFQSSNSSFSHTWDFGDGTQSSELTPSHTYQSQGAFSVHHVVENEFGCKDSVWKDEAITLGASNLTITPSTDTICNDTELTFSTNALQAKAYKWDMGDGTLYYDSALVRHTFDLPGSYTIKLHVEDADGCISAPQLDVIVHQGVKAAFTVSDTFSCSPPLFVQFTNASENADSYVWDFGIGEISSLSNPSFSYDNQDSFDVMLTAKNSYGCSSSILKEDLIKVEGPSVEFTWNQQAGCAPLQVQFSDISTSSSTISSWYWDFGNGQNSTIPNPSINFPDSGTFNIQLQVTDATGCSNKLTIPDLIKVGNPPQADFSLDKTLSCLSEPISFINISSGSYENCYWDFGDGQTSTKCEPVHAFQDTGRFDIFLSIENNGCKDTLIQEGIIQISPPLAEFTVDQDTICQTPTAVSFTNQSMGGDNWFWDFGDGNTSTEEHPKHTYTSGGIATVKLFTESIVSSCRDTFELPLHILPSRANFKTNQTKGCYPLQVRFTDQSADAVEWLWEFGDGSVSKRQNPVHTYYSPGEFDVKLIITNSSGCKDTLTREKFIQSLGTHIYFTLTDTIGCAPFETSFEARITSSSGLRSLSWDLGDGTIIQDSLQFSHKYNQGGDFDVKLQVRNDDGCTNSSFIGDLVRVFKPEAAFHVEYPENCLGNDIDFVNDSQGKDLRFNWNLGNGLATSAVEPTISFDQAGNYSVNLRVVDSLGCESEVEKANYLTIKEFKVNVVPDTTFAACPPLLVNFTPETTIPGNDTWEWDFGDGQGGEQELVSHLYAAPGNYDVSLLVSHPNGCEANFSQNELIRILGPEADISINPRHICPGEAVSLSVEGPDIIAARWELGDGKLISGQSIDYAYLDAGTYFPKVLIDDGAGCQYLPPQRDSIIVDPIPIVAFLVDKEYVCEGDAVQFYDQSEPNDAIISWFWEFGDGKSSIDPSPMHFYTEFAKFVPRLTIRTVAGCTNSSIGPTIHSVQTKVPDPIDIHSISIKENGHAIVSFSPYKDSDFYAYTILKDDGNGLRIIDTLFSQNESQYEDRNTSHGNSSCYFVNVLNQCGTTSNLSSRIHCEVKLSSVGLLDAIQLAWNSYDAWDGQTNYEVYALESNGNFVKLGTTNQTEYLDLNTFCYDLKTYRIKAISEDGAYEAWSNVSSSVPIHEVPQDSANMIMASILSSEGVLVHWELPEVPFGIRNVILERKTGNEFERLATIPADRLNEPFLDVLTDVHRTSYTYRAILIDSCGDQGPIGTQLQTILLQAEMGIGQVRLMWNEYHPQVSTYEIQRFNPLLGHFETIKNQVNSRYYLDSNLEDADQVYRIKVEYKGSISYSNEVRIQFEPQVFVPSAFSPNGDGINDRLDIQVNFSQDFSISIFNRFGRKIFFSQDPNQPWDGTLGNGTIADAGVYLFLVMVKDQLGNAQTLEGTLTLIR